MSETTTKKQLSRRKAFEEEHLDELTGADRLIEILQRAKHEDFEVYGEFYAPVIYRETKKKPRQEPVKLEDKVDKLGRKVEGLEEKFDLAFSQISKQLDSLQQGVTVVDIPETLNKLLPRLHSIPKLASTRLFKLKPELLYKGVGPSAIVVIDDSDDYYEKALDVIGIFDELSNEGHELDDILIFRKCEIENEQLQTDYEEVT